MKRNMMNWLDEIIENPVKKALPILSFPSVQLMGITVRELISDSGLQAEGMKRVAERTDTAAAVSLMDLSLEAECFGATIRISDSEVPAVTGILINTPEEAEALAVPAVGSGRTGIYLEGIRKAVKLISDRPVLAGMIGPFSLAGRLLGVSEALMACYEDPELVHQVLEKAAAFLLPYARAYRDAGADGILMAEPLAGLLSPGLAGEFSADYVKQIIDGVQEDEFLVAYHNCGDTAVKQLGSILSTGSRFLHFGNAVRMADVLPLLPGNILAAGNIDPAGQLKNGTPAAIREATEALLRDCGRYPNFVISSGCDIPPLTGWDNLQVFFDTVTNYYHR